MTPQPGRSFLVDSEDRGDCYGNGETFRAVLRRYSRRDVLKGGLVLGAVAVIGSACSSSDNAAPSLGDGDDGRLNFSPVPLGTADVVTVPEGYTSSVLIGWGDPLGAGDGAKNPLSITREEQERRFGYNNDFVAFFPVPGRDRDQGLLWVNHEHTEGANMFPGYDAENPTRDQVRVEMAAHGATVVQVRRQSDGRWIYDRSSALNRRITATTPVTVSGPAAGHHLLRTKGDPSGTRVVGTLNNCGGGTTPWGTVLTAEENFNQYFANGDAVSDLVLKASHRRYGIPATASERRWERFEPRFDLGQEPNEAHRFGWIVEVDPNDPDLPPVKRTALGRFKHEAATVVLSKDKRVVVYSGDDEQFEYVYKFVSERPYERRTGRSLSPLDSGTLHVARFDDDGTGEWIPLRHRDPRLGGDFDSEAELLIRVREAADRVGATKMDRPEDIQTNPVTGSVFMVMTNNTNRAATAPADKPGTGRNAANPRANNRFGHIIEVREDGADSAATRFQWGMFMLCGPRDDQSRAFADYPAEQVGDIAAPDNLAFDRGGNMWIATDGQRSAISQNDALHAVATTGPERGRLLTLLTAPVGAEVSGPCITADERALFVSIQHPGRGGALGSPASQWPDGKGYPRPALVVVTKDDGGRIGS
ncbi:MAG TPA: PhoX family phosphatase [Acidimicrobiia bacterium]|nr:PhoX family phosphatase [Acidimicrobiia bacterium]